MAELAFAIEWLDPEGIKGPELAATWASFSLSVGKEDVTRVLDRRAQTVRNSVVLPLYPLAEWLATHWWFLQHEAENPERAGDPLFLARHSLVDAREGYALPPVEIYSMGPLTRFSWNRETLSFHDLEFLDYGHEHLPTEHLFGTFADFIRTVIGRLQALGIEGTLLQDEWNAIQGLDAEEHAFCVASAALGIDPFSTSADEVQTVTALADVLPAGLLDEFLRVSEPAHATEEAARLAEIVQEAQANQVMLDQLRELRETGIAYPAEGSPPWTQGFGLARAVRERLGLNGTPLPTLDDLAKGLGTEPDILSQAIRETELPSRLMDGVVAVNEEESPSLVMKPRSEIASRFHICRGIAEYLTADGNSPSLISRASSHRQARNRAFAAEFLAPSSGLRTVVTKTQLASDDLEEIAEHFGVPTIVIAHQLSNHDIATVLPDRA